jgi:hypothetical protein
MLGAPDHLAHTHNLTFEVTGAFLGSNRFRPSSTRDRDTTYIMSIASLPLCAAQAGAALSTGSQLNSSSKPAVCGQFPADISILQHPCFYRSRALKDLVKDMAGNGVHQLLGIQAQLLFGETLLFLIPP